ncbi:MAG: HupE/UreJ family protein [Duganella sp.]
MKSALKILAPALLALASGAAMAHPQAGAHAHGFLDGLAHPFTGIDHLLAMLAVGIWSVRQTNAQWLPPTFIGMVMVGMLAGALGLAIPALETGIALTVATMGILIALAARLPAAAGVAMVGVFALLHGNAHGHELPTMSAALGLLVASTLLVYGGRLLGRVGPALALKCSGAAMAAAGMVLAAM